MKLGSWTDHGSVIQSTPEKPFNAIDPNLFVQGDDVYLNFGSYWQDLFQVKMTSNGMKPTSDPKNIAYDPAGNHREEGSYLYRWNGYYYLFYSWGVAGHYDEEMPPKGQEYRVKVCRSSSASGPFVSVPPHPR